MAGIHHQRNHLTQVEEQQQQQQHRFMVENASTSSPFFPINASYIPYTQQFFQYQQHPHYYRSMLEHQQHQEIRLFEPSPQVENNQMQGVSVGPLFPLSFKLGYGEDEGEIIRGGQQEDALTCTGSERYCSQARQNSLDVSHCWQNQEEDSAIKQLFWKPLNAEFSNGNNNNGNEREKKKQQEDEEIMYLRPPEEIQHHQQIIKSLEEEKKGRVVFGELEAIYADNTTTNADHNIHRIASESVLTAEDLPTNNHNVASFVVLPFNDSNQASGATTTAAGIDIGSESASVGVREVEAEAEATRGGEVHKRKRAKESRTTSTSMSRFFESLMKKLENHQEELQRRFMETIERLDEERKEREEAWREQELANLQKETAARAHERSLASSREAALVTYLEKLTGHKINFQQPIKNKDKSCSR